MKYTSLSEIPKVVYPKQQDGKYLVIMVEQCYNGLITLDEDCIIESTHEDKELNDSQRLDLINKWASKGAGWADGTFMDGGYEPNLYLVELQADTIIYTLIDVKDNLIQAIKGDIEDEGYLDADDGDFFDFGPDHISQFLQLCSMFPQMGEAKWAEFQKDLGFILKAKKMSEPEWEDHDDTYGDWVTNEPGYCIIKNE